MVRHFLAPLFAPGSIALVRGSPDADGLGERVSRKLRDGGFQGPFCDLHVVRPDDQRNDAGSDILNRLPKPLDLLIVARPECDPHQLLNGARAQGVRAAVAIGDRDPAPVVAPARVELGLHLLGPGSLGFIRPRLGLDVSDCDQKVARGHLALVSQSAAVTVAVLDWAESRGIGFSMVVTPGRAGTVGIGEVLDYLALDPETRAILLYLEALNDARGFMSGLRAAARLKPVVVIKAGRSAASSRATLSHTGALVGEDDVFEAALRRAGAVRTRTIDQWLDAAQLLADQQRTRGERLAIVTNAGGPGIMAVDRAAELGLGLAELAATTMDRLDQALPPDWPRHNPIDLFGDATPERYAAALRACLADPGVDGVLTVLAPQAETQPLAVAEAVAVATARRTKPVLAAWLGESRVGPARAALARSRIPSFPSPESAVGAFAVLAEFREAQELLMQVPPPLDAPLRPDLDTARRLVTSALAAGRSLLDPMESRALLAAFHVPVNACRPASTPGAAVAAAEALGYPVVLKILSPEVVHKSDLDAVRLDLRSADQVAQAFTELVRTVQATRPELPIEGVTVEPFYQNRQGRELMLGVIDDPVFGPVISFGTGGVAVEVLRDRAVALPPFNRCLVSDLIGRTRAERLLAAFRQLPPVDRESLIQTLLRLSELVCELPEIRELDINPLVADGEGVLALDACVILRAPPGGRPYSHMAIHPYPAHLAGEYSLRDGTKITLRPIRPEDAAIEQAFVRGLSPESRYFRFMNSLQELDRELLIRLTQLDYARELALIATRSGAGGEILIGVARYAANPDGDSAEFAVTVADAWQGRGLGSLLMCRLIEAAAAYRFQRLTGEVLANNLRMLQLMARLGFAIRPHEGDPALRRVEKLLS